MKKKTIKLSDSFLIAKNHDNFHVVNTIRGGKKYVAAVNKLVKSIHAQIMAAGHIDGFDFEYPAKGVEAAQLSVDDIRYINDLAYLLSRIKNNESIEGEYTVSVSKFTTEVDSHHNFEYTYLPVSRSKNSFLITYTDEDIWADDE